MYKDRENSIIVDTFYGQIINIIKCHCGFESFSFDKFFRVPLIFSDSNYEDDSELVWERKCEKCKLKQTHKKSMKIFLFPEILIISLQRIESDYKYYNYRRNKNRGKINFDDECCHRQKNKYKLIGMNFGHYYAYININNKWFEFNDDIVRDIIIKL